MTRDEAKQLLGGYATGSLTDAERKALFEAALEDQQLFEELAGEQDLLEILALPGAKERLAAALDSRAMTSEGAITTMSAPEEKKKRPAWWLFALAGVAGVGLLVFLTTSKKTETPVEVASTQSAQPAEVVDSKAGDSQLKEPAGANPTLDALARSEREKAQTTVEEKTTPAAKTAASKSAPKQSAKREGGAASARDVQRSAPVAAPRPSPTPEAPKQAANGFAAGAGGFGAGAADSAQARLEAQNGQQGNTQGKGGGKGGAKGQAFAAAATRPDAPPVRAGNLTYVLTGRGSLKVTAAVSGSLEVTAADRHLIGWDPVVADSTVEMPVPSGIDSLTLRFAVPGQQAQVVQIPIRQ